MKHVKTVKNWMWICTLATFVLGVLSYYTSISPIFCGIFSVISFVLCESQWRERDIVNNGKQKFGPSYMDSLSMIICIISILMAFMNVGWDLLWIVLSVAIGYFGSSLILSRKMKAHPDFLK